MKQTIKSAGYKYVRYSVVLGCHILQNESGKLELWGANKNHASYGLIYKNTHLEFIGDYIPFFGVSVEQCKAVIEE